MYAKRTSDELSDEAKDNQDSDPLFQLEDNGKREKLLPSNDTTLHDLPIELLEYILVKAVVMEVKEMKLAKSVWTEKADLVMDRLRTVCSHWSSVLATEFFQNELHRALDSAASELIRVDIMHQSPMQFDIVEITALKDEIFMLCNRPGRDWFCNVIDRNDIAKVKSVIPLPELGVLGTAACNVSSCVYVALAKNKWSVLRITKVEEHKFKTSPWITDQKGTIMAPISVSTNGSLITFSDHEGLDSDVVSIYDAQGCLLREIILSPDIDEFNYVCYAIQKSNGNFVLASMAGRECRRVLFEIDTSGNMVRQYLSSLRVGSCVNFADAYGRIMITDPLKGIELLDSEFNLLGFLCPQNDENHFSCLQYMYYDRERNEVICISDKSNSNHGHLTIFRFTEE